MRRLELAFAASVMGDWAFGVEIALLRDVPRTATVIAAATTGHGEAFAVAERLMSRWQ